TDHPNPQAARTAMLDQPENQRRLAGTTDSDIADHNDWHRRPIAVALPGQKAAALTLDDSPIERLQRRQQVQCGMPAIPAALQPLGERHQGAACASTVVMRRCAKPSLPAASIAVMTA